MPNRGCVGSLGAGRTAFFVGIFFDANVVHPFDCIVGLDFIGANVVQNLAFVSGLSVVQTLALAFGLSVVHTLAFTIGQRADFRTDCWLLRCPCVQVPIIVFILRAGSPVIQCACGPMGCSC